MLLYRVMMDYVKMEAEYNCSKEVGNKKISFRFITLDYRSFSN